MLKKKRMHNKTIINKNLKKLSTLDKDFGLAVLDEQSVAVVKSKEESSHMAMALFR